MLTDRKTYSSAEMFTARLRSDGGSDEVAGVAPDLPVTPREGESDRARAWRLLQTVAADRRSRIGK